MPTAQAHVPTTRAGRYLKQVCEHLGRLAHADHDGGAPRARSAIRDDGTGVIDFGWARCELSADDTALTLTAEADDPQLLGRVQEGMTKTLERIGRRDQLTVAWAPVSDIASEAVDLLAELLSPQGREDPYPLYARLHRLGSVASIGEDAFLVSGYDAVNQVLRDPGFGLPDAPDAVAPEPDDDPVDALRSMSKSILRANQPDHGRMRSLISQVFTPRRVATLQPAIEAAVDRLLDRLDAAGSDGASLDFMDGFAFPLPVTVICELLGVPEADRERFRPLASDLTEALELSADLSSAADAAARELAAYFTDLVAERRAHPTDDLIGALVTARDADDSRLTEPELLANLILLLVAGFETTTSLLGNGLAILLQQPNLADALRSGQLTASAVVEEVLRFDSPVQVTTRVARADGLSVAGTPIVRGSQLVLLIGAANRDPARYPDPDRFDPTRTDIKPLSFGAGAHICLGNSLARLEAATAFPRLLDRFGEIRAAAGQPPTRRDRLVLRGLETLPVRVTNHGSATD